MYVKRMLQWPESRPLSGEGSMISFCTSRNFGWAASLHRSSVILSLVVRNAPASLILSRAYILQQKYYYTLARTLPLHTREQLLKSMLIILMLSVHLICKIKQIVHVEQCHYCAIDVMIIKPECTSLSM